MKPRSCETELVRSLSSLFANGVGNQMYVTPDEARMLEANGIAERVTADSAPQQEPYTHREMVAQRPNVAVTRHQGKKQHKG